MYVCTYIRIQLYTNINIWICLCAYLYVYRHVYIYICQNVYGFIFYSCLYIPLAYIYRCRYGGVRGFSNFGIPFGFPLAVLDTVIKFKVRSSRSSQLSTKSSFGGSAELQLIENVDEIEIRRLRGAPNRALNADTTARWGALASDFARFAELQVMDSVQGHRTCF